MNKFNRGDKIRITNYGEMALIVGGCASCTNGNLYRDVQPEIVGKKGTVKDIVFAHGLPLYVLDGIPEKVQFYNENQIELV